MGARRLSYVSLLTVGSCVSLAVVDAIMQEWGRTNVALLNVRDHSREFSSELLQLLGKGDLKLGGGGARASITREEKISLVQLVAQVKGQGSCDSFLRARRSSFFAAGHWTLASFFTVEPNKSNAVIFFNFAESGTER